MKRALLLGLIAIALLGLYASDTFADCGGGSGSKSCSAKMAGCPIRATLSKINLTDAQKKQIASAKATLKASLAKASACGCPKKGAALKADACKAYKAAVRAALTPEQQKTLDAAFAAKAAKAAKAAPKPAGGCGTGGGCGQ